MRRAADPVPDSLGRYSLADGSQYRCSVCDTWLCADCGDRPAAGAGDSCSRCSTPQGPEGTPALPTPRSDSTAPAPAARCVRTLKSKASRCKVGPTDWPEIPGEPAPVLACWTHLSEEERANCTQARGIRDAERARIWAAGEPERKRRAAEAEAEQRERLATCPCAEQLPEDAAMRRTSYPTPNRCNGCGSWLLPGRLFPRHSRGHNPHPSPAERHSGRRRRRRSLRGQALRHVRPPPDDHTGPRPTRSRPIGHRRTHPAQINSTLTIR